MPHAAEWHGPAPLETTPHPATLMDWACLAQSHVATAPETWFMLPYHILYIKGYNF